MGHKFKMLKFKLNNNKNKNYLRNAACILTVTHLVKFIAFCGTRRFITVFTTAYQFLGSV